jgi:hypothetical protein
MHAREPSFGDSEVGRPPGARVASGITGREDVQAFVKAQGVVDELDRR